MYCPNNGKNAESFARRRAWEERISGFLSKVRADGGLGGKPVFYCGDLNVTPVPDEDLSHPAFFKKQFPVPQAGYSGQPGCTPKEVEMFNELLDRGDLVDAYRELTPFPGSHIALDAPVFTWRGTKGRDTPESGRYYRKGMRIDLLLVERRHLGMIESVEITGAGVDNSDPSFAGSDHCPVHVSLARGGGAGEEGDE